MPAATARGDPALRSQHISQWQRSTCKMGCTGAAVRLEPVLTRCTEGETMPAGSADSQTELISPPGRCQMTKEIYVPCSNKPLPCPLCLRDIILPAVSYTSNQPVVGDSFRTACRRNTHHVALVPSFYF